MWVVWYVIYILVRLLQKKLSCLSEIQIKWTFCFHLVLILATLAQSTWLADENHVFSPREGAVGGGRSLSACGRRGCGAASACV